MHWEWGSSLEQWLRDPGSFYLVALPSSTCVLSDHRRREIVKAKGLMTWPGGVWYHSHLPCVAHNLGIRTQLNCKRSCKIQSSCTLGFCIPFRGKGDMVSFFSPSLSLGSAESGHLREAKNGRGKGQCLPLVVWPGLAPRLAQMLALVLLGISGVF